MILIKSLLKTILYFGGTAAAIAIFIYMEKFMLMISIEYMIGFTFVMIFLLAWGINYERMRLDK